MNITFNLFYPIVCINWIIQLHLPKILYRVLKDNHYIHSLLFLGLRLFDKFLIHQNKRSVRINFFLF